jgi:hypothetical protein
MMHDKSNGCQMAVPADWKVDGQAGWMAYAPKDQGNVSLISHPGKTVKPLSEMAQKALAVDKMLDNSPQLVFFSNLPTRSEHPITQYHVTAPGKGGTCVALIDVRGGVTADEVRKIAGTVKAAQ